MLSAQASPFVPLTYEPVELAIFNDGVPSMVLCGHDVVHNITDEAIDEAFPPTAEEADEIEETEHYVNLMTRLALMEEREEAARNDHIGLLKRWEARRELVGRPNQARHTVNIAEHGKRHSLHEELGQDLVICDHSHIALEHLQQARENSKRGNRNNNGNLRNNAFQNQKNARHIQQPRKQN